MIDKRNGRLGWMLIALVLFVVIAAFQEGWGKYYLAANVVFTIGALLISKKMLQEDLKVLVVVFAWTVFTLPLTDGGIGSALTFFITLTMMVAFSSVYIGEKTRKLLVLGCILGVLFMLEKSLDFADNYKLALLRNKNPNSISAYVVCFFMYLTFLLDMSKNKNKLLTVICAIMAVYTVSNCQSRGSMIALVLYLFLIILPQKLWSRKALILIASLVVVIGTIVPFVYIFMYRNGYGFQFLGKDLFTGREQIWSEMFVQFTKKPLACFIGLGSKAQLWEHDLNVHNNFFNIIVNFGIVGYFLYFFITFRFLRRASEGVKDGVTRKAILAFICATFVLGFFESTSLNNSLAPMTYFGLLYANGRLNNEKILTLQTNQDLQAT